MNRRVSAVLAVAVSLLVVGAVRSAIPPYLPSESPVAADVDGVVKLAAADVVLLDVRAVRRLQSDIVPTHELETDEVFVVARVRITARGGTLRTVSHVQTADGRTYESFDIADFPYAGIVYVGQVVTETHIFEIPEDRLAGAKLAIRGRGEDGVQAIDPVALFQLNLEVEQGILTTPWMSVEPAR